MQYMSHLAEAAKKDVKQPQQQQLFVITDDSYRRQLQTTVTIMAA